MVEGVERIHFEDESHPLVKLEALADAYVKVVDARLVIEVAAGISISAESRAGEAAYVETVELCQNARIRIRMNIAAWREVRPHAAGAGDAVDIIRRHAVGKSLLEGRDACQFPPANYEIGWPVDCV